MLWLQAVLAVFLRGLSNRGVNTPSPGLWDQVACTGGVLRNKQI